MFVGQYQQNEGRLLQFFQQTAGLLRNDDGGVHQ